jgi:peroxiredoxin
MLLSVGLLVFASLAVSCGVTIKSNVATGYDWVGVEKIVVVGVDDMNASKQISRTLTHKLFEGGFPVVRRDAATVLDIYDIGREEGADVIVYGVLTHVDLYYGRNRGGYRQNYPIKNVKIDLHFIETETRRRIWQGTASVQESTYVADAFVIEKLITKTVQQVLPEWKEVPREATAAAMLKIGQSAPLFEVSDIDGNSYALKEDIGKNVVVLSFWSYFCEQCKEKMRLLDEVQGSYQGRDVNVVAVNVDGDIMLEKIKAYVDENDYAMTFLLDKRLNGGNVVADAYNIPGTPSMYVIGKSGEIVFSRSGHITISELSGVIDSQLDNG